MEPRDYLGEILVRKRFEVERRKRHGFRPPFEVLPGLGDAALTALSRGSLAPSAPLRVIAEIKLASPSAGQIRAREPGIVQRIARAYATGGATAISVLCDGPGFGGSVLDLRRAAGTVTAPILFKEFVLDPLQVELARACGAHLVLLLVRALSPAALERLVVLTRELGMEAVVEAADQAELDVALASSARIVGVNARDLRTFRVDPEAARTAIQSIPPGRVAVHMSGLKTRGDFESIAASRADAVLVGESLMRAAEPGARLRELLGG
jgi:indole-3-glycerol phosphate synthase